MSDSVKGTLDVLADNACELRFAIDELLRDVDPTVAQALEDERRREEETIDLIASENYASEAVRAAQATLCTNKYAEGYPGQRYYAGCEYSLTRAHRPTRRPTWPFSTMATAFWP